MAKEEEIIKKLSEISIKQAAQQISISKSMKKWKLAFSIYSDMNQFEKVFLLQSTNSSCVRIQGSLALSGGTTSNKQQQQQAGNVCVCVRDVERNK